MSKHGGIEKLSLVPGYKQWIVSARVGDDLVQRAIVLKDHGYKGEYPLQHFQAPSTNTFLCGVQGEFGKRTITDLPDEMIMHVLSFARFKDLTNLRLVSRRLHNLSTKQLNIEYHKINDKLELWIDKTNTSKLHEPSFSTRSNLTHEINIYQSIRMHMKLVHFFVNVYCHCGPIGYYPGNILNLANIMLGKTAIYNSPRTFKMIIDTFVEVCVRARRHFRSVHMLPSSRRSRTLKRHRAMKPSYNRVKDLSPHDDENVTLVCGSYEKNLEINRSPLTRAHDLLRDDTLRIPFARTRYVHSIPLYNIHRPFKKLYKDVLAFEKVVNFMLERDRHLTSGPVDTEYEENLLSRYLAENPVDTFHITPF